MFTIPHLRKRVAPNPLSTTDISEVTQAGPYTYHMGDIFTPGAYGWAMGLDSTGLGIPMVSMYGRGGVASVCCRKYTFDPRAAQVGNVPTYTLVNPSNGGVPTGTFTLTSLINSQNAML